MPRFYSLTQKGNNAFNEIKDTFVIEDVTPSFIEIQQLCLECDSEEVERCWNIYGKDLEVVLRDMHDTFPKARSGSLDLLKQEFKTPAHLREFIYWLRMLKLPKKCLEHKFANQMKRLSLEIV